jgi:protein AFG1
MSFREKDLARRFIVFIDAVYESKVYIFSSAINGQAKVVLTSEVPIAEIFTGDDPVKLAANGDNGDHEHLDHGMRHLMDDLGLSMDTLLESSIFVHSLRPH